MIEPCSSLSKKGFGQRPSSCADRLFRSFGMVFVVAATFRAGAPCMAESEHSVPSMKAGNPYAVYDNLGLPNRWSVRQTAAGPALCHRIRAHASADYVLSTGRSKPAADCQIFPTGIVQWPFDVLPVFHASNSINGQGEFNGGILVQNTNFSSCASFPSQYTFQPAGTGSPIDFYFLKQLPAPRKQTFGSCDGGVDRLVMERFSDADLEIVRPPKGITNTLAMLATPDAVFVLPNFPHGNQVIRFGHYYLVPTSAASENCPTEMPSSSSLQRHYDCVISGIDLAEKKHRVIESRRVRL